LFCWQAVLNYFEGWAAAGLALLEELVPLLPLSDELELPEDEEEEEALSLFAADL